MRTTAHKLFRLGVSCSAGLILLLLTGTAILIVDYLDAAHWVDHTTQVITEIRSTHGMLPGTQALSGSVLDVRLSTVLDQFGRVASLTSDNQRQQANVAEFRSVFLAGSSRKTAVTADDIASANAILDRMQHQEENLLVHRVARQSQITRWGAFAATGLCSALLAVGLIAGFALRRELRRRAEAEAALVRDKEELTRYTEELARVSAGSKLIQAARDEAQLYKTVEQVMRELIPGSRGYFALLGIPDGAIEICGAWGYQTRPATFTPDDCMALQLGTAAHRRNSIMPVECAHARGEQGDQLCVPVHGASGYMGVLHVATSEGLSDKRIQVISVFAAHLGLGLTNIRMRDSLRQQSVRDALTSVFNRRYFDETLRREMSAATRHGVPLAVLMIDVDYFKRLNDTHGHTAGDDALKGVARFLMTCFRESDVICRYGGEEFGIILPGSTLEQAYTRAEFCRGTIASARMQSDGRGLGMITISIGVAVSTEFGDPLHLVRAADAALYQAKRMGRNVTWTCTNTTVSFPSLPGAAAQKPWLAEDDGATLAIVGA